MPPILRTARLLAMPAALSLSSTFFRKKQAHCKADVNQRPHKIDISGLPKHLVIKSLFDNVYDKSMHSKNKLDHVVKYYGALEENFVCRGAAPIIDNFHSTTKKDELEKYLLRENGYLSDIFIVDFFMDFSTSIIDTSYYDTVHKTSSTLGVTTAEMCVELFRERWFKLCSEKIREQLKVSFGVKTDQLAVVISLDRILISVHDDEKPEQIVINKSINEILDYCSHLSDESDADICLLPEKFLKEIDSKSYYGRLYNEIDNNLMRNF